MTVEPELRSVPAMFRGSQPRSRSTTPRLIRKFTGSVLFLIVAALWLSGAQRVHAQVENLTVNGMSYIWELMYNATNLDPNADTDGDGVINLLESIAGTNPFDSNSVPRVSVQSWTGTNITVTMPAQLGKQYLLQSVTNIDTGTNLQWTNETSVIPRSGTNVSLTAATGGSQKYFRISISDVDSDGDGLTDWEEYQLGLDPLNAYSNGQLDQNGVPLTDYAFVTGKLAAQNAVSITATVPTAIQPAPGQAAVATGLYTVNRGGFPLNSIIVNLALGGPGAGFAVEGVDHAALRRSVTLAAGVSSQTITLTPLADTNLTVPVIAMLKLQAGLNYTIGENSNASVVIYPSPTGLGTGLTGVYYTNSSTNYTNSANFNPANLLTNRLDAAVDFNWGSNNTPPITNSGNYSVRWTGQVQPQFSELYTFDVLSADGVKLWVNDQSVIDKWQSQNATDQTGAITLQAGVRYDLKLDYFVNGKVGQTHLKWYSPDQPEQVIPATALYPSTNTPAATAIVSALSAVAFLGQPFSFTVVGANSPNAYTATGLPLGLSFNVTNGLISGTPTLAGYFQVNLTASNSVSLAASVLNLQVIDTGSSITREIWTNFPGTNVADIPVTTPASFTNFLGSLEGVTNYGQNYGERVRGYFTAPATGNYFFWVAGGDSAELWISDDSEQVNRMRRATAASTGSRQWTNQPGQRSPWLAMSAGQRYYVEVLHKTGVTTNDNWSVAWILDSTGTNTVPSTNNPVVPGYLLTRYFTPPPSSIPGTLFTANLLAVPGVASDAVGSATLRLNAAATQAVLNFTLSDLSSAATSEHIDNDPYLTSPTQLIFDISAAKPQSDGSYLWNIKAVGTLSAADVVEVIREGKASINIHTANHPGGELSGHFTLANGVQNFIPPPPPPAWTDDHTDPNAAARFLTQATFGASPADIAAVQSLGYSSWLSNQFNLPPTHHLPVVESNIYADPTDPFPSSLTFNAWWQQSVTAPDQLRQRVAFALSEIMVVSQQGVLQNHADALSSYYDTLLDNAFGNYRDLLKAVTLTPAMGNYLDMRGNAKGSIILGTHADENYAREIEQLFSIGLNRLWPDHTLVLNSLGNPVPTYNQNVIMGFAAVFTGWTYWQPNQTNGRLPIKFSPSANYTNPMVLVPPYHDLNTKLLLDNVVLPAAQGGQANTNNTNFDAYCSQDLESALDSIFDNQNVAPFVCRELIQRLVTSNPSRGYIYRVAQVFNDNGSGVRGDLKAVIQAILLDYEARDPSFITVSTYGKQREPLLRATAPARAFPAPPSVAGTYSQSGGTAITVTTAAPHRLNNNDEVLLNFTDTSGNPAPTSQGYRVTVTSATNFTITAPGLSLSTYGQSNNVITVTNSGHGLAPGYYVYLQSTTGGAASTIYQVDTVPTNSVFTVIAGDSATRTGSCYFPKLSGVGYQQVKTNITASFTGPHGLSLSYLIYIHFTSGSATDGLYQITSVPDPDHFTVISTTSTNQTHNSLTVYPLGPPQMNRSGNVAIQFNTWSLGATDTGTTAALAQTPLNSPTVFNFFFPDYKFPGTLASAGLTTPEFQLTSDSTVALQMNFLEGGVLDTNSNTGGLSSFNLGNGSIVMDLNPWMTTNYTSNVGLPALVSSLNTLLAAGQLSTNATSAIVSYVANTNNFAYNATPTSAQMASRVRAVVHLILTSPDYTIQK